MKELQMAEAHEVARDGAVESEELKQQLMEMKQQIWDVKQQIGYLMQHIVELKQQLCQGKVFIANNAVLAVVGVVIVLVVAIFCKQNLNPIIVSCGNNEMFIFWQHYIL
jgi:hypothetical protein